jgi:hypothetical protein
LASAMPLRVVTALKSSKPTIWIAYYLYV